MLYIYFQFDQFVVEDVQSVFSIDGLVTSHPVYVPVAHPDEINEIFDRISYAKVWYLLFKSLYFTITFDTPKSGEYDLYVVIYIFIICVI